MSLCGKFCTAPCRGGRLCLPDVSGIHRTSLFAVRPQLCLRRPTFSVAPEKVGKKMRLDAVYIARSRARFCLTPSSGANLQPCRWFSVRINVLHAVTGKRHQLRYYSFPEYSAGYDPAQHVVWADAHIGAYADAFCIPQQGVLPSPCVETAPDGSVVPRRRRCSVALQRDFRVLAAMFFYGLILWHRGTIRFASSASFCPLFLARQTEPNCKPAKRLQFGEDEQRNGRDLPLAAGRGIA